MDFLEEEILRKRKQVDEIVAMQGPESKFFKRSDLNAKREEEYWKRHMLKRRTIIDSHNKDHETGDASKEAFSIPKHSGDSDKNDHANDEEDEYDVKISRADLFARLRSRSQPILLFGECERDTRRRLRKLEIEQAEMNEGLRNDFQSAMREVDHELIEEVIKGQQDKAGRHDVDMPISMGDTTWEKIEANALLLGEGDNSNRDCDIILDFFSYLLTRWGKALNARDEAIKRSAQGKLAATLHKQTMDHLRPLMSSFEKHNVNADIREHLIKICRLLIIERDYVRANNAYMQMAIGNAPWPVGVTRSGLHQRPGSAKAYVSNIAHVLNDETQRKYIQAFKRLMTRCQKYFPTDPSKCIEYVRESSSDDV